MRLIDADALIEQTELFCTRYEIRWTDGRVMAWIDNAPTVDAVPVVRCKDCIYYEIRKDYLPYCNHADGGIADYPREDDFCSYGERRSGR